MTGTLNNAVLVFLHKIEATRKLNENITARGYPIQLVTSAITQALNQDRNLLLIQTPPPMVEKSTITVSDLQPTKPRGLLKS